MARRSTTPSPADRVRLTCSRAEAEEQIASRIAKGGDLVGMFDALLPNDEDALQDLLSQTTRWRDYNRQMLKRLFTTDEMLGKYDYFPPTNQYVAGLIGTSSSRSLAPAQTWEDRRSGNRNSVRIGMDRLRSISELIEQVPEPEHAQGNPDQHIVSAAGDPLQKLELLLRRFHLAARQLIRRHDRRPTLLIEDEYDVQDLLHALLLTQFDDIRPEDPAPTHAGKASRLDFLLKKERIVVEAKMTSATLRDARVAEQLIIDIKRYQAHPDCKTLLCLVYDPGNHISNPVGLEDDLSRKHDDLDVRVFVVPR
jgi:hypothetical protein